MENQCQATKEDQYGQCDEVHLFELAVFEPEQAGLYKSGSNSDGRGNIDVIHLVGHKKQDNWKQVKKKFHCCVSPGVAGKVPCGMQRGQIIVVLAGR